MTQREEELQKLRSQLYQRSVSATSAPYQPMHSDLSQVIHLEQVFIQLNFSIIYVKYRYIEFFAFDYDSLPISFQSGIAVLL